MVDFPPDHGPIRTTKGLLKISGSTLELYRIILHTRNFEKIRIFLKSLEFSVESENYPEIMESIKVCTIVCFFLQKNVLSQQFDGKMLGRTRKQ